MLKFISKKIGLHRNKKRVFFEGAYLALSKFNGGTKFSVDVNEDQFGTIIQLTESANGSFSVTNSKRNGQLRPVIDFKHWGLERFESERIQAIISDGKITILNENSMTLMKKRLERYSEKIRRGQKLDVVVTNLDSNIVASNTADLLNESIFSLKGNVSAELVKLEGTVKADYKFYLLAALCRTLQPALIDCSSLRFTEPALEHVFASFLQSTLYTVNEESKGAFFSKGIKQINYLDFIVNNPQELRRVSISDLVSTSLKRRIKARKDRVIETVSRGNRFSVGGLFHGVGIQCNAISKGLLRSGLSHYQKVAVEIEEKYLNASLNNNEIWNLGEGEAQSVYCVDVKELDYNTFSDLHVSSAGIPCTGASVSGLAKNGLVSAEFHEKAGALFIDYLNFQNVTNPLVAQFENVIPYSNTLSAKIIYSTMHTLFGYNVTRMTLDGKSFGSLENRKRLFVICSCRSLPFDVSEPMVMPNDYVKTYNHSQLKDALDPYDDDDPEFKEYKYLKDKEVRDIAANKGFRLQWVDVSAKSVGVITRGYAKARSTDVFVKHPNNGFARLLNQFEHARIKQIPAHLIDGLSRTTAHEALGQSGIYTCFRFIGNWIGNILCRLKNIIKSSINTEHGLAA